MLTFQAYGPIVQRHERTPTPCGESRETPAGGDPEAHLMLRVRADDPEAFEELVARYWQPLVRLLGRKVGSQEDAQDLVQDVFLRVYQARKTYTVRSKFSTWLFTIAYNLARNACRARRRKPPLQVNPQKVDRLTPNRSLPLSRDSADLPMRHLEDAELAAVVRRAVDGLKGRQRLVMLLNSYEGMGHAEIAQEIGMTPQAVKSLLSRARSKLRRSLAGYVGSDRGSPVNRETPVGRGLILTNGCPK